MEQNKEDILKSKWNPRYAIPMPFGYEAIYEAMEEYASQWKMEAEEWKLCHDVVNADNKDWQSKYGELKAENAALKETAGRMAAVLKETLPYLKAPGTNGNHWVPTVETALQDWQNKEANHG